MNCDRLDTIAHDLACGRPLDAVERRAAEAHAAACGRCARRLAAERALTRGLRALAAADAGAGAPPAVEDALMAALRSRGGSAPGPEVLAPTAVSRWRAVARRPAVWAGAAAAAALLAAVGLAAGGALVAPEVTQPPAVAVEAPPPPAPATAPETPGVPAPQPREPRRPEAARFARVRHAPRVPARRAPEADVVDKLIATTEFVPFGYGSTAGIPDSGHVVRVRVPRSVLAAEGFPVNADRDDAVTADVILADDGTARAIRFVAVADLR